jgi:hypothetical protein
MLRYAAQKQDSHISTNSTYIKCYYYLLLGFLKID